jgi:hypothetical protein
MAIYLCRWPNGEFSIVNAKSKGDAIALLDEWGNAEQAWLTRMTDCMFDFRLDDDGQIELAAIGESSQDQIMEICYPELNKVLATVESDESGADHSANGRERIRAAVELERTRLWKEQPPAKEAETQIGRDIQRQTGAAGVLVNRIVREAARKRLESKEGEGKRPN